MVDRNQAALARRGNQVDKKIEQAKANQPVPKWQAQSHQLRAMMAAARQPITFGQPRRGGGGGGRGGGAVGGGRGYGMAQAEPIMPTYEVDDRVPCRYCGRKFNEVAA